LIINLLKYNDRENRSNCRPSGELKISTDSWLITCSMKRLDKRKIIIAVEAAGINAICF
jgi:hypothetical protein